ncbi:uroporphyrinogen-III synthase [Peribacillus sp. SCS-155]|uniref:uroporphyrinogen-III synthase n=1 Tax=Peribacillus sedimenti TaxID=3115297 RepID=UPI003906A29C
MREQTSLQGYNILVTRGREQAASLISKIEDSGGIAYSIPLIDFIDIENNEITDKLLADVDQYDWVIFTSQNGVKFFFQHYQGSKLPKIAVIGSKTCKALKVLGYMPDFMPTEFVAETFVKEFLPILQPGAKVLLAKGNLARNVISTAINKSGSTCDEVIVYRTVIPTDSERRLADLLKDHVLDAITFTSSSTVQHFMDIVLRHGLEQEAKKCVFACIGPIVKQTAEKYGLNVAACPAVYTVEEMAISLGKYFQMEKD